jgi:hypothetical protein
LEKIWVKKCWPGIDLGEEIILLTQLGEIKERKEKSSQGGLEKAPQNQDDINRPLVDHGSSHRLFSFMG